MSLVDTFIEGQTYHVRLACPKCGSEMNIVLQLEAAIRGKGVRLW